MPSSFRTTKIPKDRPADHQFDRAIIEEAACQRGLRGSPMVVLDNDLHPRSGGFEAT